MNIKILSEMEKRNKIAQTQVLDLNKLASLGATLVRNYYPASSDLLTGVKCRATSVAKNSTKTRNSRHIIIHAETA